MSIKPPSLEARVAALEEQTNATRAHVREIRSEMATKEEVLSNFRDLKKSHLELKEDVANSFRD